MAIPYPRQTTRSPAPGFIWRNSSGNVHSVFQCRLSLPGVVPQDIRINVDDDLIAVAGSAAIEVGGQGALGPASQHHSLVVWGCWGLERFIGSHTSDDNPLFFSRLRPRMVAEHGPVLESASLRVENVQQGGRDAAIAVTHAEARTFPGSPLKPCQGKNEEKTENV